MRPRLPCLVLLLVTLCLVAPVATAQEEDGAASGPLELVRVDVSATAAPGETVTLTWRVVNADLDKAYILVVEPAVPAGTNWDVRAVPEQTEVDPGASVEVTVQATPPDKPAPRHLVLDLSVVAVNGTLHRLADTASVDAVGVELVLGTWENPLPPPLDNMWGAFLLNVVAWLVLSLVVMWLIDPTLKAVTRRTRTQMDDNIVHILRFPTFLVLFTFGVKQSLEVFPLPAWAFRTLDTIWTIVLVIAIVYVSYRVWQEIVLLIGRRLARQTETQLDDRLLPVFEKFGGLVILVAGIFYLIDFFGFNMTIFAAGGVLGAMVIAFAAQDTLSNFFSGVHLLVDQPFREGDDIILETGEVTTVTKIGLRSTHLYHVANHETIIVPNNFLATNRIINILRPDRRYKVRVDVGVAYGTDVQKVMELLLDIARGHPLALNDPDHQPFARFQNFGASSLDFSVHLWIEDVYTRFAVASDIRETIDQRFAAEGIEIPFPQRVVWNGREEAERAAKERNGGGTGGTSAQAKGGTETLQIHHSKAQARREQAASSETGSESGGSADTGGGGEADV